jgi:hypothetical protein
MKIFQKKSVAILLAIVMIAAGIGLGQLRADRAPAVPSTGTSALDTTLSTSAYETWIWDEAGVFSLQRGREDLPVQRQLGSALQQPCGGGGGEVCVG